MDLERIKQNLRLRSGRSKKKSRKPDPVPLNGNSLVNSNHHHATSTSAFGLQDPAPRPQTQHTYEPARDGPALRNWDNQTALPQLSTTASGHVPNDRPNLPQPVTGSSLSSSPNKRSSRFGRSGIERPRKEASPIKASPPSSTPWQRTKSETDLGAAFNSDTSDALDFDLRPPPPRPKPPSVESLSEALFSPGHLNTLLRNPQYLAQFTSFVSKYKPEYHSAVLRYLETQKAITAVEYANAVAEALEPISLDHEGEVCEDRLSTAATLEKTFAETNSSSFRTLLDSILPLYVTYKLVKVVTECLVNEIADRQTPLMTDLVGGLSEVFCLTDPNQADNPIIYASEEFYRLTGYGRDDVIGRNCRFLQGAKTKRDSISRLRDSVKDGKQICEVVLNYRRDGRPFINLLLIAPLHDDKGNVKYHIGAQVDVTGLVERSKGLEAFERYLVMQEMEKRDDELNATAVKEDQQRLRRAKTLAKLRDLSQMFDLEEAALVRTSSRPHSLSQEDDEQGFGSGRRRLTGDSDSASGRDDDADSDGAREDQTWKLGRSGPSGLSGSLPGVYDSYMLIRAAPSLRIIFISPKLRLRFGNVLQHPFLSHIAAPTSTLAGLKESFSSGVAVSAKVNFMLESGVKRDGTQINTGSKPEKSRACWISATPLLGSDDSIGVWMIVVVEKRKTYSASKALESASGQVLNKVSTSSSRADRPARIDIPIRRSSHRAPHSRSTSKQDLLNDDAPLKPRRLEDVTESVNSVESTLRATTDDGKATIKSDNGDRGQVEEPLKIDVTTSPTGGKPKSGEEELSSPITETGHKSSEDQFVRPKLQHQPSQKSERVRIRADSDGDGEPEAMSTEDLDSALVRSLPGSRTGTGMAMHNFGSPPRSPDTLNMFPGFSDDDETPRRPNHSAFPGDKSPPPPSQNGTGKNSGLNSPAAGGGGAKPSSKHYMDYLRHPGSGRTSSEYNRVPGTTLVNSLFHVDDDEKNWPLDGKEEFPDRECLGSPYSVD